MLEKDDIILPYSSIRTEMTPTPLTKHLAESSSPGIAKSPNWQHLSRCIWWQAPSIKQKKV